MKILNVRLGFACNSSSSHSILMLNHPYAGSTDESNEFGWGFFTAGDRESKLNYLASLVRYDLGDMLEYNKNLILKKIFGSEYDDVNTESYIDHESVFGFPRKLNGIIHYEFIQEYKKVFFQDNVVVLGGNDNEDYEHPMREDGKLLGFPSSGIVRKDKKNNFWVFYNKNNGSKVRFSFDNTVVADKSYAPELVDLKITDYCPFSCEYCYQNSSLDGKHANLEDIKNIAKKLSEEEVFEVAVGGGEPTLHPQFEEVIDTFNQYGIKFNFTTRNYNFLNHTNIDRMLGKVGGIAFSINTEADIDKLVQIAKSSHSTNESLQLEYPSELLNIQYVMGSTSIEEFEKTLRKAMQEKLNITLLGYKEVGRGNSFISESYDNWLNVVKKIKQEFNGIYPLPNISIDTALAAQYKEEVKKNNISEKTYHTTEGNFSLYIDAVQMKMAPSSYTSEQVFDFNDNWIQEYQGMGVEAPSQKPKKMIKITK